MIGPHSTAKNYQSAYWAGVRAFREGRPRAACPYNLFGTATVSRGRVIPTGSRSYAREWLAGWEDAKNGEAGE